jgi:predicted permease
MSRLLADLKLALRRLWQDRGFATTALVTLTVCLGGNAVLLSVVASVLLRPLPFPESDRVLLMYNSYPNAGAPKGNSGPTDYQDRVRDLTVFETQAFFREHGVTLGEEGSAERVMGVAATPSFFELLRTPALRGRLFRPEEGKLGAEHEVLLSYALWQELYAGRDSALGQQLRLNGVPHTIVGVLPASYPRFTMTPDLWTPLAFTTDEVADANRHSNNGTSIGRLKPGATLAQAQSEVDALNARNLERFPALKQVLIDAGFHTVVVPLRDDLVGNVRPVLLLLWAGVACVLLIGCVNVANLVLVRAAGRLKEIATRRALGAGRGTIARQWITETMSLTLLGGVGALLLARWALSALPALATAALPRASEIRLDTTVAVAVLGLAALLGLVLGLVPVFVGPRFDLAGVLREEGRGGSRGRSARRARQLLITAQVAFAFVLLVGAALLAASFRRVLAVDPGWSPDGVLTAMVSLPAARYAGDADLRDFSGRLLTSARRLPGVEHAGLTSTIPFGGSYSDSVVIPEGVPRRPGESLISPSQVGVSDGYLEAMGTRLVRGRLFGPGDDATAAPVVLVDETLARHFWPDQDPIGRRIFRPKDADHLTAGPDTQYLTVVGVVRDAKLRALVDVRPRVGACYRPLLQSPERTLALTLKTSGDPQALIASVRGAVATLDPELPVFDVRTMRQRVNDELGGRRVPMLLTVLFGTVALFLAALGIYGVLAYQVAQRTREIGIRMALGGTARAIGRLVLAESARLVGIGLATGALGAVAAGPLLRGLLFGVGPLDPRVYGAVAILLLAVAMFAALLPMRRAARVDPAVALAD